MHMQCMLWGIGSLLAGQLASKAAALGQLKSPECSEHPCLLSLLPGAGAGRGCGRCLSRRRRRGSMSCAHLHTQQTHISRCRWVNIEGG
jgi:hypothetical protein